MIRDHYTGKSIYGYQEIFAGYWSFKGLTKVDLYHMVNPK